jgi:hypothetical protein
MQLFEEKILFWLISSHTVQALESGPVQPLQDG